MYSMLVYIVESWLQDLMSAAKAPPRKIKQPFAIEYLPMIECHFLGMLEHTKNENRTELICLMPGSSAPALRSEPCFSQAGAGSGALWSVWKRR